MLNQRRKLLAYLRRDNFPRYAFVLHKLGLKDTYAKQVGRQIAQQLVKLQQLRQLQLHQKGWCLGGRQ
jgi:hypothetical protein